MTGVYNKKTLNGKLQKLTNSNLDNWFEDRLALDQDYRLNPDKRIIREFEPAINCLNSTGLPHPLKRINRVPKHDTTQIIPSDGFNEKQTTTKTSFVPPSEHKVKEKRILSMIHRYNLADLNLSDRMAVAPEDKGFKNTVMKEEKPVWTTSAQHFFGQA